MLFTLRYYVLVLLFFSATAATGQDFTSEKDHPGKFVRAIPPAEKNIKGMDIVQILERIPFIKNPKGFDLFESVKYKKDGNIYTGDIMIAMFPYYRYQKGPLKLSAKP